MSNKRFDYHIVAKLSFFFQESPFIFHVSVKMLLSLNEFTHAINKMILFCFQMKPKCAANNGGGKLASFEKSWLG